MLTTFELELAEVALVPGETAGVFIVRLDGQILFDRAEAGRFPELRELKQLVRDRVAPERALGHSDRPRSDRNPDSESDSLEGHDGSNPRELEP